MDTICAISTAPGVGGIGIVRISGKEAFNIADKIFRGNKGKSIGNVSSHTINYGYIFDVENNQKIDEVLLSVMRGPNTYTKEDVVEINCHGGMVSLKKTMEICLNNGARLAEPGEFTKRAFLNGRIDLAQAEAVIDIITSKTELGLEKAVDQLEGKLSKKILGFKNDILELMARIEASIDFPEHDIEEITNNFLLKRTEELLINIKELLKESEMGKIIREGISTVIVGKPNVGKSSLLNTLLRENRAIVTEVPGTTRDVIEEYINIGGVPLKVIDTAGIRETEDLVEKIGVERSKEAINRADLILFVLDNSEELSEEDIVIAQKIKEKKTIIVINKIDLENQLEEKKITEILPKACIIGVSIKDDIYLDKIEEAISGMFFEGHLEIKNDTIITNIRHKNLLENAQKCLELTKEGLLGGMPIDCVSIDLKNSLEYIGGITGDHISEDIVEEIFKTFCIGK